MKTYTIYETGKSAGSIDARADELVFVRDGFAIFAVISPFIWFIWHKLWIPLVGYIVFLGALMGIAELSGLSEAQFGILSTLLNLFVGLEANNIRSWFLERDGSRLVGVVSGDNLEECEYRFFASWSGVVDVPARSDNKGLVERLETV